MRRTRTPSTSRSSSWIWVRSTAPWPIPTCRRTPTCAAEGGDIAIDQVVIGSCTNGQLADMAAAAAILKGRKVADGRPGHRHPRHPSRLPPVHASRATPRSSWTPAASSPPPPAAPAWAATWGCLAAGERCVSTTNRNFVGRMGHVDSEVYLASPAVAAASAVTGHITHPKEVMEA